MEYGAIVTMRNDSDIEIKLEGFLCQQWVPIISSIASKSEHEFQAGPIWLPQSTLLRAVSVSTNVPIAILGRVGPFCDLICNDMVQ